MIEEGLVKISCGQSNERSVCCQADSSLSILLSMSSEAHGIQGVLLRGLAIMLNQSAPAGAAGAVLSRLFLVFWVSSVLFISSTSAIGVNFGRVADNLPPMETILQLVKSTTVAKLKIYDADPIVLTTFAGSGIDFVIAADNDEVQPIAATPAYALQWAQANIAAYPNTSIVGVALGNEVLSYQPQLIPFLLPALQNLQAALVALGLDKTVKLSTPNSLGIVAKSFPPSYGEFFSYNGDVMSPLLDFFVQNGAPFMVNIYPYFAYAAAPLNISLDYVLFNPNAVPVYDNGSGLFYTNMFDAQVDAVYAAISKLGYNNVTLAVTETGWPSLGDPDQAGATVPNAQLFNANLVKHVKSGVGTPAKPGVTVDTYIFALFNEDLKPGPTSERNFGLYQPNGIPMYNSGLTVSPQWYSPPPPGIGLPPVGAVSPPPPLYSSPPPPASALPPVTAYPPVTTYSPPPPVPVLPPLVSSPPPPVIIAPQPPPVGVSPPAPAVIGSPPVAAAPAPAPPPPVVVDPPVLSPSPPLSPLPPNPIEPSPGVPAAPGPVGSSTPTWCVAKANADPGQLQIALDWACSTGGADCTMLQAGGPCFAPNTLVGHASFAFDSYYHLSNRNYWDCFFSGTAVVTSVDPSFTGCAFP